MTTIFYNMVHITGRSQGQGHPVRVENVGELLLPEPSSCAEAKYKLRTPNGFSCKEQCALCKSRRVWGWWV